MLTELTTNAAGVRFQTLSSLLQWEYSQENVSFYQITDDLAKEKKEEYIVEFRVTVVDPEYSKLLSDPDCPQHDAIKQELTTKVTFDLRVLDTVH